MQAACEEGAVGMLDSKQHEWLHILLEVAVSFRSVNRGRCSLEMVILEEERQDNDEECQFQVFIERLHHRHAIRHLNCEGGAAKILLTNKVEAPLPFTQIL